MQLQNIQILESSKELIFLDANGAEKNLENGLSLYDTIQVPAGAEAVVYLKGLGKIQLSSGETLFLDESVLVSDTFLGANSFSQNSIHNFLNFYTDNETLIDNNEHMNFSLLEQTVQADMSDFSIDIRDLIDAPTLETKIFSSDTHTVELNQNEWLKHEGLVFEDGSQFELYSKNGLSDEVYTLLIEDTISVIDTQG